MDQKTLARWLKAVIIGTGICGLVVFLWLVPFMGKGVLEGYPEFGSWYLPWLIFLEISGLPCFGVLYLGWRIAGNIGQDRSFSMENASFLKKIAYCAAGDTVYFFIGNIALWLCGMSHPDVVLASLVIDFVGIAVSVASAGLSHLVEKGETMEDEIIFNIDVMLAKRKMSVTELSQKVGITMANISILKNGKAKAVKVSTLAKLCRALDCQPGDLLEYRPGEESVDEE